MSFRRTIGTVIDGVYISVEQRRPVNMKFVNLNCRNLELKNWCFLKNVQRIWKIESKRVLVLGSEIKKI